MDWFLQIYIYLGVKSLLTFTELSYFKSNELYLKSLIFVDF